MQVHAYPLSVPKAGSTLDEYEDAYWPTDILGATGESFSFAVADGATEASYSKIWARLLVEAFCTGQLKEDDLTGDIRNLQMRWGESVGNHPLPWYAEEKIRAGAFSSLIGLTIRDEKETEADVDGIWEAKAIGDSCLFQVRDDELLTRFPLEHSEQFNSRPALVSTNPQFNDELSQFVLTAKGDWKVGDVFYLATDALACWFLKEAEECGKPWKIERKDPDRFESWINNLRSTGDIRNDDVTMFRIELMSEVVESNLE